MHRKQTIATITLGFVTGLTLGLGGCRGSVPDPNHCANLDGDQTCAETFGDELPYCAMCGDLAFENDGCAAEQPEDLGCYSPCGNEQSYNENSSCVGDGDGDGDPGDGDGDGDPGDGDGDGDGDPAGCMANEDCLDPSAPICDLDIGECVACDALDDGDAACAELDASAPICLEGTCVECVEGVEDACVDLTPICDVEVNTCVGCSAHEQCPDSACNLAAGNCIDPGAVLHVDADYNCNTGDGTLGAPYCDLEEALDVAGDEVVILLHGNFGGDINFAALTISTAVAIFADNDGVNISVQGVGGSPAFTVAPSGALFMRDFRVFGSTVEGIEIDGGGVWLDRMRVVNNLGGAITVDNGGSLSTVNCFLGGDVSDRSAVHVIDGSADTLYTTIGAGFGTAIALECDDGSATVVRNSLLVARTDTDELVCPDVTITRSALEMAIGINADLPNMSTNWFVDYAQGDFHLTGGANTGIRVAEWMPGDPVEDIDGDPRELESSDLAGGDVLQ